MQKFTHLVLTQKVQLQLVLQKFFQLMNVEIQRNFDTKVKNDVGKTINFYQKFYISCDWNYASSVAYNLNGKFKYCPKKIIFLFVQKDILTQSEKSQLQRAILKPPQLVILKLFTIKKMEYGFQQ